MPRVIPKAKEANTVSRNPYTQMVRPEKRAMATSMAHYKREPHYKGRASEKGLAQTRLERTSDGTNTRVVAYMINKWRAKMRKRRPYSVRDPPGMRGFI
uniref:Uncharacterized protein n=1 Tax=Quercus lobata TaxID=97700 RepID=A0A7N2L5V9_QUELO